MHLYIKAMHLVFYSSWFCQSTKLDTDLQAVLTMLLWLTELIDCMVYLYTQTRNNICMVTYSVYCLHDLTIVNFGKNVLH